MRGRKTSESEDENKPSSSRRRTKTGIYGKSLSVLKSTPLPPGYRRYRTGWVFSLADERRMFRAIDSSKLFMDNYCKL